MQSKTGADTQGSAPDNGAAEEWGSYLITLVQLVLVGVVVHLLHIEQRAGLSQLVPVIIVGFAIHARAPMQYRPALFVLTSLAGLFAVLGQGALWVIGLGTVLFGLCSLPVKVWARALLVIGAGAALALYRINGTFSWTAAALPVVSSMFMYRAIVFLFDENASGRQSTLAQRFGYFFMLPAVCFPLFPVVDYRLWRTRYYKGDTAAQYRKGIGWIARGLMHIVLYRAIYHFIVLPEWEIVDSASALRSMACVYPLYLRVSGHFHFIVGVLVLFGYNLPDTHHKYFYATSFLDLWRRANIYWKDFMEKVVFYPAFLHLRRLGAPQPMLLAIALTFVATWLLHSYQWFWLRGDFPLTIQDAVFWGVIGLFVAIASVMEARRPRQRRGKDTGFDVSKAAVQVAKVVGMMSLMTLLWSFWSAPTIEAWGELLKLLTYDNEWMLWYVGAVVLAFALGIPGLYLASRAPKDWDGLTPPMSARTTAPMLGALIGLGLLPQSGMVDAQQLEVLSALTTQKLNQQDAFTQVRGYYENLLVRNTMMSELAMSDLGRPEDWVNISDTDAVGSPQSLIGRPLRANIDMVHKGASFQTNRWGMRDQDYEQRKPPRTFRIALLGTSYAMGTGVANKHVFESIVEDYLNENYAGDAYDRYEILNFAQEGFLFTNQVGQCRDVVLDFEPDAVFVIDNGTVGRRLAKRLALKPETWRGQYPKPWLEKWAEDHGIGNGRPENGRGQREALRAASEDLPLRFLTDIVELCGRDGAKMGWVWIPVNKEPDPLHEEAYQLRRPQIVELGMVPLSLKDAFDGHQPDELAVAPWDEHPNPKGHRLLAEALIRELEKNSDALGMGLGKR
jgi:hypothetical protein